MARGFILVAVAGFALAWLGTPADAGKKKNLPSKFDGPITEVKLDAQKKKVVSFTIDSMETDKKKKTVGVMKSFQVNDKTHIAFYKIDEPEDKKIQVGNSATVFIDPTTPAIATWVTVRLKGVPAPMKD